MNNNESSPKNSIKPKLGISPNHKSLKEYKSKLYNLSQIEWEVSIGLMLGDVSIQTQNKGKTYRMKFEWGDINKLYVDHIYDIFDKWVLSYPHKKSRVNKNGNTVMSWGFQTISHVAFNPLADLFLVDKRKVVIKKSNKRAFNWKRFSLLILWWWR